MHKVASRGYLPANNVRHCTRFFFFIKNVKAKANHRLKAANFSRLIIAKIKVFRAI